MRRVSIENMKCITKKWIRIFFSITGLRASFLLGVVIVLLTAIIFSTSCDSTGKESTGGLEEEPRANSEELPPESNNYQGLRFETTKLELSDLEDKYPRLVCLGDSVTFGWNIAYEKSFPYLLEKKLKREYPEAMVINSGIGGQTVVDALYRLESDVFYFEPQVVIINFGLNDAFIITEEDKDADLRNNIDLEIFKETYKQLIERISEKGLEILIMSTNPVITELKWENKDIAHKQEEDYGLYNQASKVIAEDYGLIFVDIWESFMARGELGTLLQPDGAHPSEIGLALISETLSMALGSVDLAGKE